MTFALAIIITLDGLRIQKIIHLRCYRGKNCAETNPFPLEQRAAWVKLPELLVLPFGCRERWRLWRVPLRKHTYNKHVAAPEVKTKIYSPHIANIHRPRESAYYARVCRESINYFWIGLFLGWLAWHNKRTENWHMHERLYWCMWAHEADRAGHSGGFAPHSLSPLHMDFRCAPRVASRACCGDGHWLQTWLDSSLSSLNVHTSFSSILYVLIKHEPLATLSPWWQECFSQISSPKNWRRPASRRRKKSDPSRFEADRATTAKSISFVTLLCCGDNENGRRNY